MARAQTEAGGSQTLSHQGLRSLQGDSKHGPLSRLEALTAREEDVLRFLIKGLIKKEIAAELFILDAEMEPQINKIYADD